MTKIENPHVHESAPGRLAGCFNFDGARFHVWLDPNTGKVEEGCALYKNPPLDVDRRGPGWFDTRLLDPFNKTNAPLVAELMAAIERDDLISKARAERIEREAEAKRQEAAEARALFHWGEVAVETAELPGGITGHTVIVTAPDRQWAGGRARVAAIPAKSAEAAEAILAALAEHMDTGA